MMVKAGCSLENEMPFKLINVYECEDCGARVKAARKPKECWNCGKLIKEHHIEEAEAGIL